MLTSNQLECLMCWDAWVAQPFSSCLLPREWSCSPGIESHVGLPAWSLLLPLPVSLPLSVCLSWINKSKKKKKDIWCGTLSIISFSKTKQVVSFYWMGLPPYLSKTCVIKTPSCISTAFFGPSFPLIYPLPPVSLNITRFQDSIALWFCVPSFSKDILRISRV